MFDDAQLARIRATMNFDPSTGETNYPVADLAVEEVTEDLVDLMIRDSGGERQAVACLLRGQLEMLRRQERLIRDMISMGYGRGRIRPHIEKMPIPAGPPPLDRW